MFFIVIYADILFIINFFITLLMLLVTAKLSKRETKTARLVAASVLGGLYSMIILADIPAPASLASKLLSAVPIVLTAFGFKRIKRFVYTYLLFIFSSFIFLGITVGCCMLFKTEYIAVNNDTVYFDVTAKGLLLCAFASYLISCAAVRLYNKKLSAGEIYTLKIINGDKEVTLLALSDTGNRLREPFSDSPVIVASEEKLKDVFSDKHLRYIPAHTVSSSAYLEAFKPDKIYIKTSKGEKEIENAYVALTKEINDSACSAVINPEILSI